MDLLAPMNILEMFESLFTEIRFKNPITTPPKRLNMMEANPILGQIGKKQDERPLLNMATQLYDL